MPAIEYRITPADVHGHRYVVDLWIREPNPDGQRVQLPSWIPGSYMIRDFSKHIELIEAFQLLSKNRTKKLVLKKINNSTWELPVVKGSVCIRTRIYAFDTSVRTAYLDQYRGFFNPSSLCLQVLGQAHLPCLIQIEPNPSNSDWEAQTTLEKRKIDSKGFGTYLAHSYDELIDHPVALGNFTKISWKSHGIAHHMAIQGHVEEIDRKRLLNDLKPLCEKHIEFFDPRKKRAPFKEYLFLVNTVGQGYGGLEHRSSTALLCNRSDLPYLSATSSNAKEKLPNQKQYEDFLGLCSHEYFHAWMVKKVQPEAFQPYALDKKNYTQLLWLFEGFTSYYDDLQLFRSRILNKNTYLQRVIDNWNLVLRNPGRKVQSIADSSFDAWTKYYQMDENTPNAVVSYYAKGALVALGLDLIIRQFTQHKKSLDDVMRALWKKHGAYGNHPGKGINEHAESSLHMKDDFTWILLNTVGHSFNPIWKNFYRQYIAGTQDIPLVDLLKDFGISVSRIKPTRAEEWKAILGIRTVSQDGWVKVTHVLDGGTAKRAGLAPNDIIASINQERVTPGRLDQLLRQLNGNQAELTVYRHDLQIKLQVSLKGGYWDQYELTPSE